MLRLLTVLIIIAFIILTMTGVIEIKVHADRLGEVPGRVMQFINQPSTWEKARVLFTRVKRWGEQVLVKDADKKLEVSLVYVKDDAERLNRLVEKYKDTPEAVLPQAELLVDSMKALQKESAAVSLETIMQFQEKSREVFSAATESLEHIKHIESVYEAIRDRLSETSSTLEQQLKDFVLPKNDTIKTPTPSPKPSVIPLRF